MIIVNDNELKAFWMLLKAVENNLKLKSVPADKIEFAKNWIIDTKKSIRKYYRDQESKPERRYFDSEEAGYYRIFGETDYKSVEEAEENHVPLTCYPDQLGRWFEISHKFFKRSDGKICGYAWMAMNW